MSIFYTALKVAIAFSFIKGLVLGYGNNPLYGCFYIGIACFYF